MAMFDFLAGDPDREFDMSDPNTIRLMAGLGSGISQGQPFGQAAGTAAQALVDERALQEAIARKSQERAARENALIQSLGRGQAGTQREGLMSQVLAALRGDPTGKNLLGPKEDMNTLDSITVTNDGINIKAPNPSATRPFENVTDISPEGQRRIGEPTARGGAERFPFL